MGERAQKNRQLITDGIAIGRMIDEETLTLRLPKHMIERLSAEAERYGTDIDSTVLTLIWMAWEMIDN